MSSATAGGTADAIQLHFCQKCGISVPVGDIETGRARPAPGGYICPGCIYEELAATGATTATPPSSSVYRVLSTLALLYLVGATSFLLYRELHRVETSVDLSPVASREDTLRLDEKLTALADQQRGAVLTLQDNDQRLSESLTALNGRLSESEKGALRWRLDSDNRDYELSKNLLGLAKKTVGLKDELATILAQESEAIRAAIQAAATAAGGAQTPVGTQPSATVTTQTVSPSEQSRQVQEEIRKLGDMKASETVRYSAAMELGHLRDPSSVEPLVKALNNDPDDLVQRGAAWALGKIGDKAVPAVPALIAKLGGKAAFVGYMCDLALQDITKSLTGAAVDYHYDPTLKRKERAAIRRKWEQWWEQNRAQYVSKG
ncbi:MAG: HEAT repeat domain-containing protein [Planctomycetota bacterium]|nr:HEAT repeat domain-containing protein [Planctomycetota bacterium]